MAKLTRSPIPSLTLFSIFQHSPGLAIGDKGTLSSFKAVRATERREQTEHTARFWSSPVACIQTSPKGLVGSIKESMVNMLALCKYLTNPGLQLLVDHEQSILGETGLDKVAKSPQHKKVLWDEQLSVFQAQFDLACDIQRPVSVRRLVQTKNTRSLTRPLEASLCAGIRTNTRLIHCKKQRKGA